MHIDDDTDEDALVILYGLLPAREYEIELAIASGEDSIRGKITTEPSHVDGSVLDSDLIDEAHTNINSTQPPNPATTRSATPTLDSPPNPPLTVEERASQLLQELSALSAEKEAIVARLKSARKESQRADHALRNEIEALKRASEKAAQTDLRNRQRFIALQGATRQLLSASVEADEQVKLVEESLPPLEDRLRAVETEYQEVQKEAARSRAQVQEALKSDKRRVVEMEVQLASLSHRLDKLSTKRDKLVSDTVPTLEDRLSQLGKEIEEVERSNESSETSAPIGAAVAD
ncbi:uncharacterized protein EI90DRAFT_3018291 [Cantharellus anzutake]|uniref:uncharacterized protein n=1 Tax=Cantharellus anzutake TaxID=1750568 RepID=UPI001906FC70|nr:uncharacterized protein EI90DRAFT_3018291 [Cantharellus anzutake]KAF8327230.1 hypothetical protein EI90DRAFT_3018291 [Cantharellus anzutake]